MAKFDVDVEDTSWDYVYVLNCIFLPTGVYLVLLGYRLPRVSLSFIGLVLGGSIGADVGWYLTEKNIVAFGAGAGVGVLLALLLICVEMLMMPALGALGAFVVYNYVIAPGIAEYLDDPRVLYGSMGAAIVVGAVAAWLAKKWVVLVLSALIGGYFLTNGGAYFFNGTRLDFLWLLEEDPHFSCKEFDCVALYSIWAFLFVASLLFQFICLHYRGSGSDRDSKDDRRRRQRAGDDDYSSDDQEYRRRRRRRRGKRRDRDRRRSRRPKYELTSADEEYV